MSRSPRSECDFSASLSRSVLSTSSKKTVRTRVLDPLLEEERLLRPRRTEPAPLGGDALGAIADVEGDGPQPAPRGEGAKAQQELAQDRAATADRDDRKASARVPRAADDRGRAKRIAGHEHPTPFCRGADVSDGEVTPLPARADLDERSQGLSHRLHIDARRLPRDRARQSRCFMTPQVGGATEPKAPRGLMYRGVVGRGREADHRESAVARECDPVRDQRGRDPATAIAQRYAAALEPRLTRGDLGQLPHPDDAPADFGDEERSGPARDPCIEQSGHAVPAVPDRLYGLADTSFVAGPRATDDQLHAVILPDRLPGGSRQRGFQVQALTRRLASARLQVQAER